MNHLRDGINHVESHLNGAMCMVGSGLRKPGHAIIAIPKDFDSEAMIILMEKTRRRGKGKDQKNIGYSNC